MFCFWNQFQLLAVIFVRWNFMLNLFWVQMRFWPFHVQWMIFYCNTAVFRRLNSEQLWWWVNIRQKSESNNFFRKFSYFLQYTEKTMIKSSKFWFKIHNIWMNQFPTSKWCSLSSHWHFLISCRNSSKLNQQIASLFSEPEAHTSCGRIA